MWSILLLVVFFVVGNAQFHLQAQQLTSKDKLEIRNQAKSLIGIYEDLLNTISSDNITKTEINRIIENSYSGTNRLFYTSGVLISDDINPNYSNKSDEKLDEIKKYLEAFDIIYTKVSYSSISFSDIEVSAVEDNEYIYVRVYFTSKFSGSSKTVNNSYKATKRVAEVRAENINRSWKTYIASVRFQSPYENKDIPSETNYYSDSDGDGVYDSEDECPNVRGPKENRGCPYLDYDNDGVIDIYDRCKYEKGPSDNNGCPYTDSDSDGVIDKYDQCPNEWGLADNNGCPKQTRDLKKRRFKMGLLGIATAPFLIEGKGDASHGSFNSKFLIFPGGGITFFVHSEQKVLNFSFGARYVQKGFSQIRGENVSNSSSPIYYIDVKYHSIEAPFDLLINSRGKSAFALAFGLSFNYNLKNAEFKDPFNGIERTSNSLVNKYNAGYNIGIGYIGNFRKRAGIHIMACYNSEILETINTGYTELNGSTFLPFENLSYRLGYFSLELTLRLW